jgi:hypothetical protein
MGQGIRIPSVGELFSRNRPPPIHSVPPHTSHNVYEQNSVQDTIANLHECCFSPVKDTPIKAIANGHFASWPGLTVDNVCKYLPKYDAMVMAMPHESDPVKYKVHTTKGDGANAGP